MAKLENKSKDNPRLEQRLLADGQISLYLEYYLGRQSEPVLDEFGEPVLYESGKMAGTPKFRVKHVRRKENLNLYLVATRRTPIDRNQNKQTLQLAKKIRQEREQELLEGKEGYRLKKEQKQINFLDYMQEYIDGYTKADVRVIQMALNRFKSFLADTPEYSAYKTLIKPNQIDSDMIEAFTEYLQHTSTGEGAKTIYQRFKKVIRYAVANDVMRKNPCINKQGQNITIKVDDGALIKDVLSPEEIKMMIETHYPKENLQVRNAFLFSLNTGMRWCDVRDLTFGQFDFTNKTFAYNQNKTKGHSTKSNVSLPLTDTLLGLMGEQPEARDKDELVFTLPSHTMALKALRRWTKFAGIDKHITFHCARHSFGTNMASTAAQKGFSIRLVQDMLGHSSLRYTERYTRVVDEQKKAAMAELSKLMG